MLDTIDEYLPEKQCSTKFSNKNPWITSDLIALIKYRDKLNTKRLHSKLPSDELSYKKLRNKIVMLTRQAKSLYLNNNININFSNNSILFSNLKKLGIFKSACPVILDPPFLT